MKGAWLMLEVGSVQEARGPKRQQDDSRGPTGQIGEARGSQMAMRTSHMQEEEHRRRKQCRLGAISSTACSARRVVHAVVDGGLVSKNVTIVVVLMVTWSAPA